EMGDVEIYRQKIGSDRRDALKFGLQPLGVAEVREGGAQRRQGVRAEPGPEALEEHVGLQGRPVDVQDQRLHVGHAGTLILSRRRRSRRSPAPGAWCRARAPPPRLPRSEEHTSELQSRENLVCRLLLEKKKDNWEIYLTIRIT